VRFDRLISRWFQSPRLRPLSLFPCCVELFCDEYAPTNPYKTFDEPMINRKNRTRAAMPSSAAGMADRNVQRSGKTSMAAARATIFRGRTGKRPSRDTPRSTRSEVSQDRPTTSRRNALKIRTALPRGELMVDAAAPRCGSGVFLPTAAWPGDGFARVPRTWSWATMLRPDGTAATSLVAADLPSCNPIRNNCGVPFATRLPFSIRA